MKVLEEQVHAHWRNVSFRDQWSSLKTVLQPTYRLAPKFGNQTVLFYFIIYIYIFTFLLSEILTKWLSDFIEIWDLSFSELFVSKFYHSEACSYWTLFAHFTEPHFDSACFNIEDHSEYYRFSVDFTMIFRQQTCKTYLFIFISLV